MSEKQDRTYARTAQDIERKYQFGKTFSEMLGLINDNRDKVDSVESELRNEITEQSTKLMRDTEQIVMEATKQISDDVSELSSKVEMKVDAEDVSIVVEQELANGVDRVETKTGYTFDYDGLTIRKSGQEMTNKIDNTGMYVTKNDAEILTANNQGVGAVNLHAKTYLIVGSGDGRSRFEDYGINETGCYWIGG
jgi:hypothetical protein